MNSYFDTVYDRVALNDELDAAQVNEIIATIARATNGLAHASLCWHRA